MSRWCWSERLENKSLSISAENPIIVYASPGTSHALINNNNEVIFIGDSWIDIVASNSANIASIVIYNDKKQIKELNKFKPSYIANSYQEIIQILNRIYNISYK